MLRLTVALIVLGATPARAADTWEEIRDENGIKVWRTEIEGSPIVKFRGRGKVKVPIKRVAAVVSDLTRRTEWQRRCQESRAIQNVGRNKVIAYYRVGGPALVDDRDIVVEARIDVNETRQLISFFFHQTQHADEPPRDNAVRMPQLEGYWSFRRIAADVTEVTYEVMADPGGWIPAWIANIVAKNFPFHALEGLRSQVHKGGYDQDVEFMERAVNWQTFDLAWQNRVDPSKLATPRMDAPVSGPTLAAEPE